MTAGLWGLWVSSSMLQNICKCSDEPMRILPRDGWDQLRMA